MNGGKKQEYSMMRLQQAWFKLKSQKDFFNQKILFEESIAPTDSISRTLVLIGDDGSFSTQLSALDPSWYLKKRGGGRTEDWIYPEGPLGNSPVLFSHLILTMLQSGVILKLFPFSIWDSLKTLSAEFPDREVPQSHLGTSAKRPPGRLQVCSGLGACAFNKSSYNCSATSLRRLALE